MPARHRGAWPAVFFFCSCCKTETASFARKFHSKTRRRDGAQFGPVRSIREQSNLLQLLFWELGRNATFAIGHPHRRRCKWLRTRTTDPSTWAISGSLRVWNGTRTTGRGARFGPTATGSRSGRTRLPRKATREAARAVQWRRRDPAKDFPSSHTDGGTRGLGINFVQVQ